VSADDLAERKDRKMSARVVVFGSINMDLVAGVSRISAPGETVAGHSFATFPGGKGGNQALAAHHASGGQAAVALVGKVGDDTLGQELLDFYRQQGLATDLIARSAGQPTGTALIQVERESGQNSIVVVAGANGDFTPDEMAAVPLQGGDILLSQFEVPLDCIGALFHRGRSLGAINILNPAPAKPIDGGLLGLVDILVPNETELAFLSGAAITEASSVEEIAAAARALANRADQRIVVTLGPRGALAVAGEETLRVPGRPVTPVDTTGAGDCFVGTLAVALARGKPFASALAIANTAASLSVQKEGAGPSMPTAKEISAAVRSDAG
jgi:ribokinase